MQAQEGVLSHQTNWLFSLQTGLLWWKLPSCLKSEVFMAISKFGEMLGAIRSVDTRTDLMNWLIFKE
jgi:hypothetical protein